MAAVGGVMDESYAERAKKANVQPSFKNNFKPQVSRIPHDAVDVPSASTSDTLGSSPAHSSTHTPASNLMMPPSIPVSSASSEQASPLRSVNSLPPRNAWSDRSPWRTPQKPHPVANSSPTVPNGSLNHVIMESTGQVTSQETHSRFTSPVKAPAKSNQQNDSDPFVVNYNLNTTSIVNVQDWPQVGIATASVSSPHRPKHSVSSVSSTTVVSVPQTPAKGVLESENDATPSKKPKAGEKTKWVPIPPKELQAAVDEATRRSQPGSCSSKSRSPHINGRGPRNQDDLNEGRQGGRPLSRGDRSSPITAGNTRHDRNPSLTVPSSASSRRVSPLILTTSLPPISTNTILDPVPASDSPLIPREPSPSQPQSRNITNQRSRQNPAFVEPFVPLHHPNRSSAHSRNPSQNPHAPPSPVVYAPIWSAVPVYMPYFPPQNPYPSMPHPTNPPFIPSTRLEDETRHSRSPRQKRRRRPRPANAVALAGYRSNAAETLQLQDTEHVLVQCDEEDAEAEGSEVLSISNNPHSVARTRDPWWSYGMAEELITRWLRRHQDLKDPSLTGQQLSQGPRVNFGVQLDGLPATIVDSPVESAILQGGGENTRETGQPMVPSYHPGWAVPGAGPSAIDIGLAMGMPLPPMVLPPPPLLIGIPPPPPYLPSPASTTSRMDWASRDDSFSVMQSHPLPYQPYGYPPPLPPNGHVHTYAVDGQGRGNYKWRDDRFTRGGRARGFNGRGRGFRGSNVSRLPYNSQLSSPGGSTQPTYPPQHLHNSATVYIPEPVMHPSMYPYSTPLPPPSFSDYHQAPVASADSSSDSQGRPPSPKPLTHLNFSLDVTRYKLLGQIEYYFSRDNVAKDIYLRERMDSNGWVSIAVLQSFPRIQRLTVSDDLIRDTLQWSHFVEVRHNHLRMAQGDWRHFVLPTAPESTVPDAPPPTQWYPPPPFHPGYMASIYQHQPQPQPYPFCPPQQKTSPLLQGGVADHILRRPEEKIFSGNGVLESGTSAGDSFDSTPHTEGEEVETSEEDVVFLIGDPLPMQRAAPAPLNP